MPKPTKHIFVCTQGRPPGHPRGCCQDKGSAAVFNMFLNEFQKRNLWGQFQISNSGCLGPCQVGSSVVVYPEGVMYSNVTSQDVNAIIDEHLLGDQPVQRLLAPEEIWG